MVDFVHPAARVWRALTEPENLGDWLAPCTATNTSLTGGSAFTLRLDGLVDGPVEGEVAEAYAPYRLTMRWSGLQLRARVSWELLPTPLGCRLEVRQSGFLGLPAGKRRERWLAALTDRFRGALPAVLETLAEPDADRAAPARPSWRQNSARFDRSGPRRQGQFAVATTTERRTPSGGTGNVRPPRVPRQRSGSHESTGAEPSGAFGRHDEPSPDLSGYPPAESLPSPDGGWRTLGADEPTAVLPAAQARRVPPRRWRLYAGLAGGAGVAMVVTAAVLVLTATRLGSTPALPEGLRGLATATQPPAEQAAMGTPGPVASTAPLTRPHVALRSSPPAIHRTTTPAPHASVPAPPVIVLRPVLSVAYTVERTGPAGPDGYTVTARIGNPGGVPVSDWVLSFTLTKGQRVDGASGAEFAQNGTTVTLTPGSAVPPHGSITVSFGVSGQLSAEPGGCVIDGQPCG